MLCAQKQARDGGGLVSVVVYSQCGNAEGGSVWANRDIQRRGACSTTGCKSRLLPNFCSASTDSIATGGTLLENCVPISVSILSTGDVQLYGTHIRTVGIKCALVTVSQKPSGWLFSGW